MSQKPILRIRSLSQDTNKLSPVPNCENKPLKINTEQNKPQKGVNK